MNVLFWPSLLQDSWINTRCLQRQGATKEENIGKVTEVKLTKFWCAFSVTIQDRTTLWLPTEKKQHRHLDWMSFMQGSQKWRFANLNSPWPPKRLRSLGNDDFCRQQPRRTFLVVNAYGVIRVRQHQMEPLVLLQREWNYVCNLWRFWIFGWQL